MKNLLSEEIERYQRLSFYNPKLTLTENNDVISEATFNPATIRNTKNLGVLYIGSKGKWEPTYDYYPNGVINQRNLTGYTLGTNGVHTSSSQICFYFDAGSSHDSISANLGQQSGTFDIAQVKLEDGSVATDGWHPYDGEFGGEVQACQRYLPIFTPKSTWTGQAYGGNLAGFNISFLSTTRVAPTGVVSNNSFNVSRGDGGTTPVVSFVFAVASTSSANINATLGVSFLTVGQASILSSFDGTLQFIGCEL
jgi:hypothetical protein